MQSRRLAISIAALLACSVISMAQVTRITSLSPLAAKVGDLISANGVAIGSTYVDELYLTNGTQDVKVEMVEQTDSSPSLN